MHSYCCYHRSTRLSDCMHPLSCACQRECTGVGWRGGMYSYIYPDMYSTVDINPIGIFCILRWLVQHIGLLEKFLRDQLYSWGFPLNVSVSDILGGAQNFSEELLALPTQNVLRVSSYLFLILVVSYLATWLWFPLGRSCGAIVNGILWVFIAVTSRQLSLGLVASSQSLDKFSPWLLVFLIYLQQSPCWDICPSLWRYSSYIPYFLFSCKLRRE